MDKGLAPLQDWSGTRAEVLSRVPAGIAAHYGGNQIFIDVVGDRPDQPMRFTFTLFEHAPLAFANFMSLCTHRVTGLGEAGHSLTFKRSTITKIVKGSYAEGGDITLGTGHGGDSIFGVNGFEPETFGLRLKHDTAGLLTMVPRQGSCLSKFRITLGPMPSLDGACVVIGRIVSGAMHLPALGNVPVDASDRPVRPLTIIDAGQVPGFSTLPPPMPIVASTAAATPADVAASAEALRGSVASAVQAALKQEGGASSGSSDADGGGGSKKRAAVGAPPPAAKRAAHWDTLAFASEMGEDDDDDDDADEA